MQQPPNIMEYATPVKWFAVLFVHESPLLWTGVLMVCALLSLFMQGITSSLKDVNPTVHHIFTITDAYLTTRITVEDDLLR